MLSVSDIKFALSGGVSNTLPLLSLGGVRSSTLCKLQSLSSLVNVTGVVVHDVFGNVQGTGTLSFDPVGSRLIWKPPSSVVYYSQVTLADGYYTVGGSNGYIYVYVTVSSLPTYSKLDYVTVTNEVASVFDSVSSAQSLDGSIEYRCLYLVNRNVNSSLPSPKLWVNKQPSQSFIDIALDPAGVGDGVTTGVALGPIPSESNNPYTSLLSFSRPLTSSAGISLPSIGPGQSIPFWQRRTVVRNTSSVNSIIDSAIVCVSGLV